jgi:hypothetical protein
MANERVWALIVEWEGKTLSLEVMEQGTQQGLVRGSVEGSQTIVGERQSRQPPRRGRWLEREMIGQCQGFS